MSGFVGMLHLDGAPVDRDWLQNAANYLAFRGPDAQSVWCKGSVGFGHALLRATFESAHEQQPCSLDGQVWITAAARIDGRRDLLASLRANGRDVPDAAPDVTLILHAYTVWGEECVHHLIGDFAFALWDGRGQRFFCARDHFGVAPFYYARQGAMILVSNTLNVLRLHPQIPTTLDDAAVGHFLLTNQRPGESDNTTFAAIRRLRPAHTLTVEAGAVRIQRYWAAPAEVAPVRSRCPEDVVEGFRAVFDLAVGDRLRTDHVGTALSGGMDSTSVAATAHGLLAATNRPFVLRGSTIIYEHLIPDEEGKYAQQVADACGFPIEFYAAEEYIGRAPTWSPPYAPPEPWSILGLTAEEAINRRTSQSAQIYLMGFGGDPLFSSSRVGWRIALRHGYARTLLGAMRRRARALQRKRQGGPVAPLPAWLQPDFVQRTDLRAQWETTIANRGTHNHFQGMAYDGLWENLFMVADPGFTGVPVQARFPFFDLRLFTFMQTVPPEPWCRGKHLLRAAMQGRLPQEILERPKTPLQGFPHLRLLQEHGVPQWMYDLSALPQLEYYVNNQAVTKLLAAPASITPLALGQLTSMLAFAYWLKCLPPYSFIQTGGNHVEPVYSEVNCTDGTPGEEVLSHASS